ncbi:uncharacterized protein CANTADRAFT_218048 [Suhomyces tanzawaensis NRRL Y-17324]|uniref:Uncharacterized protein n=1 Tax=Suhomyces tanzawaensis NRRL Y-17324 TaxID=984487 RepID=A0A1E4SK43_9ASCO|nr:uncharacterized protein CANTADRAFT_218048 [Suhomyces tanzawaensis NRRL Y-17324]ODV79868.1 hypothetical protein CANTADRAFT_218048 [Suhomyces tanzawaensis NRRL Y-17324]
MTEHYGSRSALSDGIEAGKSYANIQNSSSRNKSNHELELDIPGSPNYGLSETRSHLLTLLQDTPEAPSKPTGIASRLNVLSLSDLKWKELQLSAGQSRRIDKHANVDAVDTFALFFELPPWNVNNIRSLYLWEIQLNRLLDKFPSYIWMIKNPTVATCAPSEIGIEGYVGLRAKRYITTFDNELKNLLEEAELLDLDAQCPKDTGILYLISQTIKSKAGEILRYQIKEFLEWRRMRRYIPTLASINVREVHPVPKRLLFVLTILNKFEALDIYLNPPEGRGCERVVLDEIVRIYEKYCNEDYEEMIHEILEDLNVPIENKLINKVLRVTIAEFEKMLQSIDAPHDKIIANKGFNVLEKESPKSRSTKSGKGKSKEKWHRECLRKMKELASRKSAVNALDTLEDTDLNLVFFMALQNTYAAIDIYLRLLDESDSKRSLHEIGDDYLEYRKEDYEVMFQQIMEDYNVPKDQRDLTKVAMKRTIVTFENRLQIMDVSHTNILSHPDFLMW